MLFEKLKDLCKKRAYTITRLCKETDLSQTTMQNMKHKKVRLETLRKIADVLNLTDNEINELVQLNDQMPSKKA